MFSAYDIPQHLSADQYDAMSAHEQDVQRIADQFYRNEILACQSSLVEAELGGDLDGFQIDDIENLYPNPDCWSREDIIAWLDENVGDYDNGDAHDDEDDYGEYLCQLVRDNAEPAEILEWWLITPSLAHDLDEIGEPVLRNPYGQWWGRTCSGQHILSDGTLQRVARRVLERRSEIK